MLADLCTTRRISAQGRTRAPYLLYLRVSPFVVILSHKKSNCLVGGRVTSLCLGYFYTSATQQFPNSILVTEICVERNCSRDSHFSCSNSVMQFTCLPIFSFTRSIWSSTKTSGLFSLKMKTFTNKLKIV